MSDQMLHLGIDVGTTAIKAAVFDERGVRVADGSANTETLTPQPGWSEQNMESVWLGVCTTVRKIVDQIDATAVKSIGVVGQGDGLWSLDAEKKPVRNAILWNDQRAVAVTKRWIEDGTSEALAQICRTAIWPGTSAAAYVWLRSEEPEVARKIALVCNAKDWIGYRLTGTLATDFADATIPFLELDSKRYSQRAFELCNTLELSSRMQDPRLSHECLGALSRRASEQTGLPAGIPVAVGTIDLAAMHVGAGLNDIGNALLILGTTAVVSTVVEPSSARENPIGATIIHPRGDRWINAQAPQSGASALEWFAARFPDTAPNGTADATHLAESAPAGSNGVLFHPYLTGERAPFVEPQATGAFIGLRSSTSSSDLARAVLEGVAFCLRHCLEETGLTSISGFVATGGGARSSLWRQILCDVLNAPVQTSGDDDLGLWGAALLGAGAAGQLDPYSAPARGSASSTHEPQEEHVAIYQSAYTNFRSTVDALRPHWHAGGRVGE